MEISGYVIKESIEKKQKLTKSNVHWRNNGLQVSVFNN